MSIAKNHMPEPERTMMSEFRAVLGERIRSLREERGYSQLAFSKKAMMSREMLRRIEQGTVSLAADRLPRIAAELGVSVVELLVGVEKIHIPERES
ncbi:helix-turn-helix domain-containing protein [Leucobacter massiliensis]|nr:helix-turn-helix transcriptional regulator [Leucobacter massiliensis]